ncbi:MAG: DNA polymerase III subunit epsilon [Dongiaceae bacterium]
MREIVLDTETTGLDPAAGHRIVEVACLELINHLPSGRQYQQYLDPERDVPPDAEAVHGLTTVFLSDKPRFAEVAEALIAFIGDARLVIHNAEFDMRFLNAELAQLGRPPLPLDKVTDTLLLARQKFPGAPASLDALCRRFTIDNSARTRHGALLDAELLAEVYLELIGGRQAGLELVATLSQQPATMPTARVTREPRPHSPDDSERAAHAALVALLKNPLWTS